MSSSRGTRGAAKTSPAVQLRIVDVEKVKGLSNYYVHCADGSSYYIHRRFKVFEEMQSALEKRFPIEAGTIRAKDRILPHLPGKKLIGRNEVRGVTDQRLPLLNTYLQNLYSLPNNIRNDSIITHFSSILPEDMTRSYTPRANNILSLSSSHGNKPSRPNPPPSSRTQPPSRPPAMPTLRPPRPPQPTEFGRVSPNMPLPPRPPIPSSKTARGKALYTYSAMHCDELSFNEGDLITLLEQLDSKQWWKASLKGKTGLAPANYIQVLSLPVVQNYRDSVHDSDEWESSDGEVDGDTGKGLITYYYNDAARTVQVDAAVIARPTYVQLYRAIQKQLYSHDWVLNYKDVDGDLVQLRGQQDMQLLSCDATPPSKPLKRQASRDNCAPWAIHVTKQGDYSVYNIAP